MKNLIRSFVLCLAITVVPGYAAAPFPDKPVRLIVPYPPGGGTDTLARILNKKLSEILGQPVVIDNRSGAQGNLGTAIGAKARPDGYTVTLVIQGALAINPHIYSDPGYDPIKDFAAVSRGTEQSQVLSANPNVPAKTLKELIDLAKSKPGVLTLASSAAGPQLVGELFKLTTGTNLLHVPYKGSAPAVIALLSGDVGLLISGSTSVAPHVKTGKVRAIAVFGKERSEALPDVPSALEQGYPELSDIPEWFGFAVPTGTPEAIINALNAGFVAALKDPAVQKSIRVLGLTPSPSTPQEFAKEIRFDYERWGKVVKAVGMKVD
ncbi:MAG: tripartite tricarboxylate transporter substrate binding protein [Betaproteobacteria bacterium]|nr:tripartite tricarboxylate transporter substrate binding protein [Betaproteobacteria bacterium]